MRGLWFILYMGSSRCLKAGNTKSPTLFLWVKLPLMNNSTLLSQALPTLPLRQETIKTAQAMGYPNLQAIINDNHASMSSKPGFSYRWFFEIYDFLEKNGLASYLERNH